MAKVDDPGSSSLHRVLRAAVLPRSAGGREVTDAEVRDALSIARAAGESDATIIDAFEHAIPNRSLLPRLESVSGSSRLARHTGMPVMASSRARDASDRHVTADITHIDPTTAVRIRGRSPDRTLLSHVFLQIVCAAYGIPSTRDPRAAELTRHPEIGALQERFINQQWDSFRDSLGGSSPPPGSPRPNASGDLDVSLNMTFPAGVLLPRRPA